MEIVGEPRLLEVPRDIMHNKLHQQRTPIHMRITALALAFVMNLINNKLHQA